MPQQLNVLPQQVHRQPGKVHDVQDENFIPYIRCRLSIAIPGAVEAFDGLPKLPKSESPETAASKAVLDDLRKVSLP